MRIRLKISMKKNILTLLILVLINGLLSAQDQDRNADIGYGYSKWSLAGKLGVNVFDGDVAQAFNSHFPTGAANLSYGVSLERSFNPRWGLAIEYMYLPYGGKTPSFEFSGEIYSPCIFLSLNLSNLLYKYRTSKWNVYANFGTGISYYNAESTSSERYMLYRRPIREVKNGQATASVYGFNVEYNFSKPFAVSWHTQYRFHNKDNFEALQYLQGNSDDGIMSTTLGLRYKIHPPDKDHIRNSSLIEFEPDKALAMAMANAKKVDDLEALLKEFEDQIKDTQDDLTETKGKIDSLTPKVIGMDKVISSQFSDDDADGDGVPDIRDLEPYTPPGSYVNYWGQSLPKEFIGSSRILSIYFAHNKYELTSNAHATIREVAIRMIKNPELKVEVRGYTDYSGSSKYNLELSTMRAARVKRELVRNYGIEESRIITNGLGKLVEPRGKFPLNRRCDFFFDK